MSREVCPTCPHGLAFKCPICWPKQAARTVPTQTESEMPSGMVEVTKAEFFAALVADSRDIMPSHEQPTFTPWLVVRERSVWGWTTPGWRNPGAAKVYAIFPASRVPS